MKLEKIAESLASKLNAHLDRAMTKADRMDEKLLGQPKNSRNWKTHRMALLARSEFQVLVGIDNPNAISVIVDEFNQMEYFFAAGTENGTVEERLIANLPKSAQHSSEIEMANSCRYDIYIN